MALMWRTRGFTTTDLQQPIPHVLVFCREDHQLLQRAWRRLSKARKAGLVRTHFRRYRLSSQPNSKGVLERSSTQRCLHGSSAAHRQQQQKQRQPWLQIDVE